ncbi:MAG: molybdopterin dinucleotide binding domain-containing protein, partial [Planctomycetota bacterium]
VGPSQPASVHALAWSINAVLGNLNKTVTLTEEPAAEEALCVDAIADLVEKMNAGEIDTLLILGGNPVFDAPADLDFAAALKNVKTTAHLALYDNETSNACDWHLPEAHYLECWGDGRAWDGTLCLQQPLIEPLFGGKSPIEVLATLAGDDTTAGYDLVRRAWSAALKAGRYDVKAGRWASGAGSEKAWRAVVHDGLLAGSGFEPIRTAPGRAAATGISVTRADMQIAFRADPKVYDGRFANNGWLQELPETITKITWDNPAWVSIKDAQAMGLENGDVIKITVDGRSLDVAVFVVPGQAPGVIALTLGQGRTAGGRVAEGVGFNTYTLRTTDSRNTVVSAQVEKTGQTHPLAVTSIHHLIDTGRLDQAGTDAVAEYGLNKRIGKKVGDEGILIKQASLAEYLE